VGIVFRAIHANYWPESRAGTQAGHVSNLPMEPGQLPDRGDFRWVTPFWLFRPEDDFQMAIRELPVGHERAVACLKGFGYSDF
jgi:hypothetical protein